MNAGVASTRRQAVGQAIDELDLGALGRALWRRRRWIIGLTLLAAGLAFIAVNLITPRYKSKARVLVETRENIFLWPDAEKTTERGVTVDQEAVTSQVQFILSRNLAREVIKKLRLGERPEFDPALRATSVIRVLLGLLGLAKDPLSETPEERVLKSFAERLSAFQVEKSRVIAIEFESEDPELAARAANSVAETYLVFQQTAKQDQSRAAGQWLAEKIETLRKAVADAEVNVEKYRANANLMVGTNNTTLSNQQLGEFNTQLATARAQKADAEAKARIIRDALRTGAPIEFSDIVNSELIRRLSEQRVTLRGQLAEQSSTLLDFHPRIKELKAQIADLEGQMRTEAERLARSLENDARLTTARVESLGASLDQLKRQAATINERDVQLRALEREAKSQRDLLESYLAKYREATARDSIGAASPDARIISTASVSNTPSWPKKLPTVLIAALSMLALSVGLIATGQLLGAASVRPASDIVAQDERAAADARLATGQGIVPDRADARVALPAIEELARELAAAGDTGRRVAVMATRSDQDTAPVAMTLARTLDNKARVVLIELAQGEPVRAAVAADPPAPGIGELIAGTATFGQIITRDRSSRIHVVGRGQAAPDLETTLRSARFVVALEALARSYDHVVIDVGAPSDAAAERLAQLAPRAVLIADRLTALGQARLLRSGFAAVNVLPSAPAAPQSNATGTRAAA